MKDFEIVKGDDIYVTIKKSYFDESDKELSFLQFKFITLDDLIENINYINQNYNRVLDVSLVDTFTLRLFDKKSKEVLVEYDIDFDLYRSVGKYCWNKIKV